MSLGKQLARTIQKAEGDKIRREQLKKEAERARKEAEERQARVYINERKRSITEQITSGKRVKPVKLPRNFANPASYEPNVEEVGHPFFFIFETFIAWLDENDLEYDILHAHDGIGIESWYELHIAPKGILIGD